MNYPNAWQRIVAFLLDYLLILGYLGFLALVGVGLTLGPTREVWTSLVSTPLRTDLLAFLTTVMPVALYFALSESSSRGATWGKTKMGLRVVRGESERISLAQAFARSALKLMPWQMAHTSLAHIPGFPMEPQTPPTWTIWVLGVMWVLVAVYLVGLTRVGGHRTIYDRASSTHVVRAAR